MIVCGDLNVAHRESTRRTRSPTAATRAYGRGARKLTELLEAGFVDSFRFLYPDAVDAYSW